MAMDKSLLLLFCLVPLCTSRYISYHDKCLVNIREYWKEDGSNEGVFSIHPENPDEENRMPFELMTYKSVNFQKISPETTILWYLRSRDAKRKIRKFILYAEETISQFEASRCGLGFLTPDIETSQLADDSCRSSILESYNQELEYVPFAWTSPRCGCIYLRADVVDDRGLYFTFENDPSRQLQKLLCVDNAASSTEGESAFDLVNVYSKLWYEQDEELGPADEISIEVLSDPLEAEAVSITEPTTIDRNDTALNDPEILEFIRTLKKALEEMHANDTVSMETTTIEKVPPHDLQVYLLEPKTTATPDNIPTHYQTPNMNAHRYTETLPEEGQSGDLSQSFPSDVGVVIQDTDGQGYLLLEASAEITVREHVDDDVMKLEDIEDTPSVDSKQKEPVVLLPNSTPQAKSQTDVTTTERNDCIYFEKDCLPEVNLIKKELLEKRKPYLKMKAEKHLQGQITCCEQGLNFALNDEKVEYSESTHSEEEVCKYVPEEVIQKANDIFGVSKVICKTKYLLCCYAAQPQNARSSDALR